MVYFTYKNNDRVLKLMNKQTINDPHIKDAGEYYEIHTLNDILSFKVNDITKNLNISYVNSVKLIGNNITFKLWEESYTDIILPGKIEKIHKTTLVRSVSYEKSFFNDNKISIYLTDKTNKKKNLTSVLDFLKKIISKYKHFQNNRYDFMIYYDQSLSVLKWISHIALLLKRFSTSIQSNIFFIPLLTEFNNFDITKTSWYEIRRSESFKLNVKDFNWMIYSKTNNESSYFTKTYSDACSLLAKIKFGHSIPFFMCGVALFEDYYMMPIFYENLNVIKNDLYTYSNLKQFEDDELILDIFKQLDII